MENTEQKKVAKSQPKKSNTVAIRISVETRKKLLSEIQKANKKTLGRKVKADLVISTALWKLNSQDTEDMQRKTLSNHDRMEQVYRQYISKFGQISRDEFFGKILDNGAANFDLENAANPLEKMQK